MKKLFFFITCLSVVLLLSCKSKTTTSTENETSVTANEAKTEGLSVCIWDKVSLRETPEAEGKWLTSINLGEKCTYLNEEKEVTNGNKTTKYVKVELQDGKQGWVQTDFIVIGGQPAAITQEATVYSRPDLLTKTDKSFKKYDIIGINSEQNNFIEVTGKRKDGKWIETGWIKPSNLSKDDIDVAVAKYAAKAMANDSKEKQQEAIQEIVDNADLAGSVFIEDLKNLLAEDEEMVMDKEEIDSTDIAID